MPILRKRLGTRNTMIDKIENADVIVIGGGLAGLTTTAFLARAGKSVTLLELSSNEIGGRARTSVFDGFHFIRDRTHYTWQLKEQTS
jgi:phytoene dehydrogenase-like protein